MYCSLVFVGKILFPSKVLQPCKMVTNAQRYCNILKVVSLRSRVKKNFFFSKFEQKKAAQIRRTADQTDVCDNPLWFKQRILLFKLMSLIGFSKKLFKYSGISIKGHTMKRTLP